MYNNGSAYIWIPSSLTFNRVTTETAAIINTVHAAMGLPSVTVGSTNPYYLDLNDLDLGGAPFTRNADGPLAVCGPILNLQYLSFDYIALIIAFGGDVEGLPVWFEITDPKQDCPFSTATPKETWEEWAVVGESHKPVKLGTKWYRSSAQGQAGNLLKASEWMGLKMAGAITVKSKTEYLDIVSKNTPKI